ncbi:hypothetical protein AXG93_669s1320 [Marchantia polymorpha subsp. ruderalis]|uniref:Uncharacterized protein n=1 Tax=Marchantia polymorpha subsp. ruderalis TaxID=1480154 RepID=A0A176WC77_MARPO|nr:hypothetical protein AXG93_669s1320 [Marchantia polymorpha subsp. ruderalis]
MSVQITETPQSTPGYSTSAAAANVIRVTNPPKIYGQNGKGREGKGKERIHRDEMSDDESTGSATAATAVVSEVATARVRAKDPPNRAEQLRAAQDP